jgi:hypothetical protein
MNTLRYNLLESETELKNFIMGFSKILHCDMEDEHWQLVSSIRDEMYSKSNKDEETKKLKINSDQSEHILKLLDNNNLDFSPSFRDILTFRLESIIALRVWEVPEKTRNSMFIKKAEFQRLYSQVESKELAQK